MDEGRALPERVNIYSNATLLGNWREDRLVRGYDDVVHSEDAARRPAQPFTLSGADATQYARDCAAWASLQTTTQDAYAHAADGAAHAAAAAATAALVTRPHDLPRQLLLSTTVGNGSSANDDSSTHHRGDIDKYATTNAQYGAHYTSMTDGATTTATMTRQTTTSATTQVGATLYDCNIEHERMMHGSRTRSGLATSTVGQRTFADLAGVLGEVKANEQLHDAALADHYSSVKQKADTCIAHYTLQRKLPPLCVDMYSTLS